MILLQSSDFANNNYGSVKIYDNVDGRTTTATGSHVNFYAYPNSSNAYDAGFLIQAGDARNEIDYVQLATHSPNSSSSYFSDLFIYPNGITQGGDELGFNVEWADTFDVNFVWRISTYAGFPNMYIDGSMASVKPFFKRRTKFMGNIKEGTAFDALMPAIGTQAQSDYPSWDNALITASIYIFEAPATGTYTIATSNSSTVAPVPYPRISIYDYQDFSLEHQLKDGGSKIGLSNTQGQQEILQTVDLEQGYHVIMLHNGYKPNVLEQLAGTGATQRSTKITITLEKFYINYNANGGQGAPEPSGPYSGAGNITISSTKPTRTGYTFKGWSTNQYATESSYTPGYLYYFSGTTTLYAVWAPINYTYTISYVSTSGKTLSSSTTVTNPFGSVVTISPGKNFNGYKTPSSQQVSWDSTTSKNIVFTYTPETYKVTFDLQGGTGVSDTTYTIESSNFRLGTPSKEGYTFAGWTGSNGTTAQSSVTIYNGSVGDKSYTAHWTPKSYAYILEYKTASGLPLGTGSVSNKFGSTYQVSTTATFRGYNTPTESQSVAWDQTTAKTITFVYTPITYTITYYGLENATVTTNPIEYNIETPDFYLNNPTKVGHDFSGWGGTSLSGTTNKSVLIAKGSINNRSYTAYWKIQKFQFSIGAKDAGIKNTTGTSAAGSYNYQSTINLNAALNTGYTFSKWVVTTTDPNLTDKTEANCSFTMPNADVTMTPTSIPITCTVLLDNNSATSAGTQNIYLKYNTGWYSDVNTTSSISSITIPKKTGYVFKGYYTSNSDCIINESGAITTNRLTIGANNTTLTLYASWEPIICKVILDSSGADVSVGTDVIYLKYNTGWYSDSSATNSIILLPNAPTKTGYTFKGYYSSNNIQLIDENSYLDLNKFTFAENSTQITLSAKWEINSYNITFVTYSWDDNSGDYIQSTLKGIMSYSEDGSNYTQITQNTLTKTFNYNKQIYLKAIPSAGYNFLNWEDFSINVNRTFNVPANNYTIKVYFGNNEWSLTPKLKNMSEVNLSGITKFWIRRRQNNLSSWSAWAFYDWNTIVSFPTQEEIQVIIEDGEMYEFNSMKLKYTDNNNVTHEKILADYEIYKIQYPIELTVEQKVINTIKNICIGSNEKSSGYVLSPLSSYKHKIDSIWCGNKQILGKNPSRSYPYKEDTLLNTTLYIGSETTELGKYGENGKYRDNTIITKVVFPKEPSITFKFDKYEFYQCSNLNTFINLPATLDNEIDSSNRTILNNYTFYGTAIKSIIIPNNINALYQRAFYSCTKLQSIFFPNDLTYIGSYTFYKCTSLKYVNLKNTKLQEIYSNAFRNCSKLSHIILPDTLNTIGSNTFLNCSNLTTVMYSGTISEWNDISISSTGNTNLINATIYCKDGIINP